jgi:hypothetical protein
MPATQVELSALERLRQAALPLYDGCVNPHDRGNYMTHTPDASPHSESGSSTLEPAIPADVLKKIKHAWIAGVISGVITLILTLLAMTGTTVLGFAAWELIDVACICGLTFGIYKKNRICAILMLICFIIAKILLMIEAGKPTGVVVALAFIYYYPMGVVGTFQYHRFMRAHRTSPPVSV